MVLQDAVCGVLLIVWLRWKTDPYFASVVLEKNLEGMRLLHQVGFLSNKVGWRCELCARVTCMYNQDPIEAIFSFICSSNNNVSRYSDANAMVADRVVESAASGGCIVCTESCSS